MKFPVGLLLLFLILAQFSTARVLDDALNLQKNSDSLHTKLNIELQNRDSEGSSADLTLTGEILQNESVRPGHTKESHYFPSGHMENIEDNESIQTFNELPSGPSPGVGHSIADGHVAVEKTASEAKPAMNLNKLPSGPSPGVGNSLPDGHVAKVENAMTLNKLPSGSSPGVGNSIPDGHMTTGNVATSSVRPQSGGPSPGAGHGFENDNAQKSVKNAALGSMKARSSGASHSSEDARIGCAMGGGSGNIKLFEGSSLYGTPTSTMFGIAAIDSRSLGAN